ncbi:hypothetical protein B0T24DRAFT_75957 [Lasiosphaeria ovina]|uniref:Uncharacterized protein n=1 Tax=Lasiosphaeria ovina TaxID=92902 RepID=A0AAE0NMS7_9PEZI|nr:hypothetical protein B0T24DRAFT_75957 [Lasiosphaeria ovina]
MQPFSSAYCWKGELKKKPPFWAGWLVGWPQCTAVMAVFLSVWSGRLRENSRMEEGCHHEDLFFSPVMLLCARVKSGRSRALTTLTSVMSALLGHVVRHACEEEGGRGGGMTGRCPKPAEVLLLLFPPMDVPSHCDSRELGFGIVKFDPAKTDGSQPPPVCVCVSVRFLRVHMGVGRVWSLRHQTLGRPYRRCRVYVVARLRCSEEVLSPDFSAADHGSCRRGASAQARQANAITASWAISPAVMCTEMALITQIPAFSCRLPPVSPPASPPTPLAAGRLGTWSLMRKLARFITP